MNKKIILFADDEVDANRKSALSGILGDNYEILIEKDFKNEKIEKMVSAKPIKLLLLDLCFEKGNDEKHGENILSNIRKRDPLLPVIILTGAIKEQDEIISGYGHPPKRAWYFSKAKLSDNSDSFKKLVERLIKEFEECSNYYKDTIETEENLIDFLDLGSRDYFISKTSLILKQTCFKYERELTKKTNLNEIENVAFFFLDVDRLHNLNEVIGYNSVNSVIKNFSLFLKDWLQSKKEQNCISYFEIGRYFRERGDEIVILLHSESENSSYKIFRQLLFDVNEVENQKLILGNDNFNNKNLSFTFSGGLFNFPTDLSSYSKNKLISFLKNDSNFWGPFDEILKEISTKAIKLKDNAKTLGRNQICPFSLDCEKITITCIYHEDNVHLIKKFINDLFDETTYNFEFFNYESLNINNTNLIIVFTHFVSDELSIPTLRSIENLLDKLPKNITTLLITNEQINRDISKVKKYTSIELIDGDFRTVSDIKSAKRKNKIELYNFVVSKLKVLSENKYGKKYYPLPSVQKYFNYHFNQLKNDMILFDVNSSYSGYKLDEEWVKRVYETLNIKSEEEIWINNRKNLKTGKDKSTLVLSLEINSKEVYNFLFLESARNYIKIQNYFDGLLKAYIKLKPNINELNNLLKKLFSDEDFEKEIIEKSEYLVCRAPLCPPSSLESYSFYFLPTRVRMDIKFSDEIRDFSLNEKIIYHLSLDYAKKHNLIQKKSPIEKFIEKHKLNELSIVTYLGSEQIGPSIYLGIVTKAIVTSIYQKFNNKSLKIYDLFAGSGADILPSLDDNNIKYINVNPVDLYPSLEMLKNKFANDSRINPVKTIDIFECLKNEKKLKELFDYSLQDKIDFDDTIDLIIADPPHYRISEIINSQINDDVRFLCYLSKITKVFIIYFAHTEQENMADYVLKNLTRDFDYVYIIKISSEFIAISFNAIVRHLLVDLLTTLKNLFKDYKFDEDEIDIKQYYFGKIISESNDKNNSIILISGPSGAGKNTFIEECKKLIPEEFLDAVSIKTRALRPDENTKFNINVSQNNMLQLAHGKAFLTPNFHEVNNNMYGKLIYSVKDALNISKSVIIELLSNAVESASVSLKDVGIDNQNIIRIFIEADNDKLKNRIRMRDPKITEEEIEKRLLATEEERKNKSKFDKILYNNGTQEDFINEIKQFLETKGFFNGTR